MIQLTSTETNKIEVGICNVNITAYYFMYKYGANNRKNYF